MSEAAKKEDLNNKFDAYGTELKSITAEIQKFIWGQDEVITLCLTTILSRGHTVLVGLPGLGKTRLVRTLSQVLGLDTKRIQCTPDLMPADILGSEILREDSKGKREFSFISGPVFCQLLMADEINRASPRTQSALLESMQEHRVTVAGHTHALPEPFHVIATQNPLEQEGTYPLPEAQRDRFLMQVDVEYPDIDAERKMVLATTAGQEEKPKTLFSPERLLELQNLVEEIPVGEKVLSAALDLTQALRPKTTTDEDIKTYIEWAPGPRASQALIRAAKSYALLDGRAAPTVEDVLKLAHPVLKHRMAVSLSARAQDISVDDMISRAVDILG
jgi:MoxR-like ATPase